MTTKAPAPLGDRGVAYRPELDGVRAVAIALVLVNHATGWVIGWDTAAAIGHAGVTVFFVLSGYLITTILLTEREGTGSISLRGFYFRRVARLAPALLLMLGFVALVGSVGGYKDGWQLGLVGALTYTANWFDVAGLEMGPLVHTWSLAVEEQFYLLWPLVLVLLPGRARVVAFLVIGVGVICYATLPWTMAIRTTPACAVGLMAGALAAMHGVGSGRVGFLSPLAPLGKRAYSLYLWSWPMTMLLGPLVGLGATFLAAELSYRLVERPIIAWARSVDRDRLVERLEPVDVQPVHLA